MASKYHFLLLLLKRLELERMSHDYEFLEIKEDSHLLYIWLGTENAFMQSSAMPESSHITHIVIGDYTYIVWHSVVKGIEDP